jgi:ankyrin repeat protein
MQRTALHTAAAKGKPAVVHLLLEAGADAEARDASAWGSTALHLAAEHGHVQYVFCSAPLMTLHRFLSHKTSRARCS